MSRKAVIVEEKYSISINFLRYLYNTLLEGGVFDTRELMFDGVAIMKDDLEVLIEYYVKTIMEHRSSIAHPSKWEGTYFDADKILLRELVKMDVKAEVKRAYEDIARLAASIKLEEDVFIVIKYQNARKLLPKIYASTFVISKFERMGGRLCVFFPYDQHIIDEKVGITDEEYLGVIHRQAGTYSRIIFNATHIRPCTGVKLNDVHTVMETSPLAKRVVDLEKEVLMLKAEIERKKGP